MGFFLFVADMKSIKEKGTDAPLKAQVEEKDGVAMGDESLPDKIILAVTRKRSGVPHFLLRLSQQEVGLHPSAAFGLAGFSRWSDCRLLVAL
jgi:hypothetical protein